MAFHFAPTTLKYRHPQIAPCQAQGVFLCNLIDEIPILAVFGTQIEGGLEIPNDAGTNSTVIANAAAVVRLDV